MQAFDGNKTDYLYARACRIEQSLSGDRGACQGFGPQQMLSVLFTLPCRQHARSAASERNKATGAGCHFVNILAQWPVACAQRPQANLAPNVCAAVHYFAHFRWLLAFCQPDLVHSGKEGTQTQALHSRLQVAPGRPTVMCECIAFLLQSATYRRRKDQAQPCRLQP